MKKQYISPESQSCELGLDSLLDITSVNRGDLANPIEMDGEAADGTTSDSRRRDIWSDEEDGYEY